MASAIITAEPVAARHENVDGLDERGDDESDCSEQLRRADELHGPGAEVLDPAHARTW